MTTTTKIPPSWRRVLVYGLGLSGRAASRLLRDQGLAVLGVDAAEPRDPELDALGEDPEVELATGREPGAVPAGVDAVVLSPGVPPDRPLILDARRRGIPVLGEVELAFPWVEGPILAVTGSNGKSTTVALTGTLAAAGGRTVEVCGNIGLPLSEVVADPVRREAVFVIELSSFQLETIRDFRAGAAALLNLSPDHLDRYPDLAAYRAAKERIFGNQTGEDVAVLPADDPELAAIEVPGRRRRFSRRERVSDGCWLDADGNVMEEAPGEAPAILFRAEDVPLPGPHNLENAMAAALLARSLGVGAAAIREGLGAFSGLPHRTQRVAEIDRVSYYDDSKGTNVGATLRALEGFPDGSVHLILGGRAKGGSFEALIPAVARKAAGVYLIGEAAESLAGILGDAAPWERCRDLPRAVSRAASLARPGDVVLLSPACASFDQYASFRERGQHFQRLVRDLERSAHGEEARV